jgi:methionyl-tRNA formyltransferase
MTIDWTQSAIELERQIRALYPVPAAVTRLNDQPIKIFAAALAGEYHAAAPGDIVSASDGGITVRCGTGALNITELQRAGSRRMSAAELLRGYKLPRGARFS